MVYVRSIYQKNIVQEDKERKREKEGREKEMLRFSILPFFSLVIYGLEKRSNFYTKQLELYISPLFFVPKKKKQRIEKRAEAGEK